MKINLREATENDAQAVSDLYIDTVKNINSKDYSEKEVAAWISTAHLTEKWKIPIEKQYFILAEIDGVIAGFGSIDPAGYLDYMYVHKDYQRAGVAKALLEEIERKAAEQKNPEIFSHVSRTARGFFEKHGYICTGQTEDPHGGVIFINNNMVKKMF